MGYEEASDEWDLSSIDVDRILPTVRVDCSDEVLCALRAKQCELDILVDSNKTSLSNLYQKLTHRIRQQEMETKADVLDQRVKTNKSFGNAIRSLMLIVNFFRLKISMKEFLLAKQPRNHFLKRIKTKSRNCTPNGNHFTQK